MSNGTCVENGTPQGSGISLVLFNVMVNDNFKDIGSGFGFSLFADDGAVWKRGRNIKHITEKIQEALNKIMDWGSRDLRYQRKKQNMLHLAIRKLSVKVY